MNTPRRRLLKKGHLAVGPWSSKGARGEELLNQGLEAGAEQHSEKEPTVEGRG